MFGPVSRGLFRMEATPPWVLDDALALVLVGPVWQELHDQLNPLFPGQVARESRAFVCARSRYAEDRLAVGAFTQYVILGAGLDSFAWRTQLAAPGPAPLRQGSCCREEGLGYHSPPGPQRLMSSRFRTFPEVVRGKSSTNLTILGMR